MALVVLLKGINVGGYRSIRPSILAKHLRHLDVVNVGAAGTLVVRKPVSRSRLRAEIARRLPFDAAIMICSGRDILRLCAGDPFAGQPTRPDIIRFVSVLGKRRPPVSPLPRDLPPDGKWCVKVLVHSGRFVLGLHRREMRAIGFLGQLERVFGARVTTRSWSTFVTIARILDNSPR
jgi:uncharacterized protein (DUF1697 family)